MFKEVIKNYKPSNEQELVDKKVMLDFISKNDDALDRNNLVAHFTTSVFIVNESFTKVVYAFHNIYNNWAWIGGHNDNDANFLNVALKEAKEETGLVTLKHYGCDPIMIDVLQVENHYKNDQYINDHLHLNLTYLLIGQEDEQLSIKADENSDVKWIDVRNMVSITNEERMKPVYMKGQKIINKIKNSVNNK